MLGLKKCSEEDFYEFMYSNSKYHPRDADGYLLGNLIAILIFSGLGWFYIEQSHIKCSYLISIIIKMIIMADVAFLIFSEINKKKYAFKFQKFFMIAIAINWFAFSLVAYPIPLIEAYYYDNDVFFNIITQLSQFRYRVY